MSIYGAILLAAGRSRRMGSFKPLLPFGAKTVIETCVSNVAAAGVTWIVVVTGHRNDEVQSALGHLPVAFALNPNPDSEMSDSIACGIDQLDPEVDAFFVMPADLPAISSDVFKGMIEARKKTGAKIVQPVHNGRSGHPVLIDSSFRNEMSELDQNLGLRGFLDSHSAEVLRLGVDSQFIRRDIDTWDDYIALHMEVFGSEPANRVDQ